MDADGNILDMEVSPTGLVNHGILEKNEPQYIPTKEEIETKINLPKEAVPIPEGLTVENAAILASQIPPVPTLIETKQQSTLSIQQQIDQAEKHLADLKVQKKEEIARRKAELAELEKE